MSNFDCTSPGDTFDSRDLIERLEELRAAYAAHEEWREDPAAYGDEPEWDRLMVSEMFTIETVNDENNYGDWQYGETCISDYYFTEYTQETLEGCGYVSADMPAFIHIDWERTAEECKADYNSFEMDGTTYWRRSY